MDLEFKKIADHVYHLEDSETFTATLLPHPMDYYTGIFVCNHIIMDDVSWQLALQKFERFYSSPDASYQAPSQYTSFAKKQRQLIESGGFQKEQAFWKPECADLPEPLPFLPFAMTSSRKTLTR